MYLLEMITESGALSLKSFSFLLFVVLFSIIYFAFAKMKFQRYILLAGSLVFIYVMTGIRNLIIVLSICLVVWMCGLFIGKNRKENKKKAAIFYVVGLVSDLGLLIFFKYFNVLYETVVSYVSGSGEVTFERLIAPIGLSYFALSLAAYLVDVKHGKIKPEENFFDFALFTTYFPAITEGPINLYKNLSPQLKQQHEFSMENLRYGFIRILWGYFLKNVIADRTGILVNAVLGDDQAVGITIFAAMFFYSFQLYADFTGGINVIMGVSEILGIKLPENFKSPFVAKSITEYWQRWHMTLGTIMEKYVYYPLVLSKSMRSLSKKIKNDYLGKVFAATAANFLVFILVGIWHGTGWNYVVYGLYQAFFTSLAILAKPLYSKMKGIFRVREDSFAWRVFCVIRTIILLIFGRLLIKASDLSQAVNLIKRMLVRFNPYVLFDGTISGYMDNVTEYHLVLIGVVIILLFDIFKDRGFDFRKWLLKQPVVFRYAVYAFTIFVIILLGIYGAQTPYIYAQY